MDNFDKRMQEEVARNENVCLWMSFIDDSGFLGVIITKALGPTHAIVKTQDIAINPGGEIQIVEVDPDGVNEGDFDRLMSKTEVINAGYA